MFATIAADAVLLGRLTGLLDGAAGVVVAAVLVLLVPTSRELPRRILLAGCLLLGVEPGPLVVAAAGGRTGPGDAGDGRCSRARWPPGSGRPTNPVPGALTAAAPACARLDLALGLPLGMGIARTGPWLADKTPTHTLGMLTGRAGTTSPTSAWST